MKKNLTISTLLLFATVFVKAQAVNDSVFLGAQYANQIWYSLANDEQGSSPKNNWDIAFEANGFSATILLNTAIGDELWVYPNGDTSAWTTIDTAGITGWPKLYNSEKEWELGAFSANYNSADPMDLGWGTYNTINHHVTGDSLFIIKLANGTYKKIWIQRLANSIYEFRYAGIDGSGDVNKTLAKPDYAGKNFGYFNLQTGMAVNREPLSANWDLTFTQYTTFLPQAYPVTGVLANKGVEVAKAYPVNDKNTYEDYASETFSTEINTIGYDWKTFNNTTFSYDLKDSLVFFVKDQKDDIWKLILTGFSGSSNGKITFSKENLTSSTNSIAGANKNQSFFAVYPNPANAGSVTVVLDAHLAAAGEITITDLQGKTVATQSLDVTGGLAAYTLNTGGLQTGVYFVKVASGGSLYTQKLIITN